MASETSDLTFVRCPSCRSLVPASASRCRICNNPLDGLNKDEPDPAKAVGRVRQKTITASSEEVEAVLRAAQGGEKPAVQAPPPAAPPVSASAAGSLADHLDPLGAYLQEIESGPVESEPAPEAKPAAFEPVAAIDEDDLFDLDIFDEPLGDEPVAKTKQAPAPEVADPDLLMDAPIEEVVQEVRPRVEAPPPRPAAPAQPPREARPPQQMPPASRPAPAQEQPRRPDQRPQQQRQQQQQQQQPQRAERMQEQRQFKAGQGDQGRHPQQQQQQRRDNRDNREGNRQDRPARQAPPPREQVERREPSHDRPVASGPKTGKMRPGRLFGWLVSYESPDGRAIELREGKFFVTSSSIKGSDLILEDPSISTPHAMMSISETGLLVQDLMSDYGVFFRAADDDGYRREDSVIRVSHGDWIKFGDVEFLVIIVPGSSR